MAYTPEQRRNIATALRLTAGDSPRVRQALLEAMAVESNFRNLHYGDRDSMGVLQQRRQYYPNSGKNPAYDIAQFLVRARRAAKQVGGTPGQLAQAVQRSAFPGRYDQRAQEVSKLVGGNFKGSPGLRLASALGGAQSAPGASAGQGYRAAVAQFLLQQSDQLASGRQADPNALLNLAVLRQQTNQSQDAQAAAPTSGDITTPHNTGRGSASGDIRELFYDPLGGIKFDKQIGAIGGHSDHVHMALSTLGAQLAAENRARQLGLRVGQEQNSDVQRVHVADSYHYRNFPGSKFRQAADVSGNPRQMAAFYRWVASRYGR